MARNMAINRNGRGFPWRVPGWAIPVLLLSIPFFAGFDWSLADYLFMGLLLGLAGVLIELGVRASRGNVAYRLGVALAVLAGFLLIWVNGAVGLLGDENNPANLMFGGVIVVALIGAAGARFRAAGMARAMLAATAAQGLSGVTGLAGGWTSPGLDGVIEVVMGTCVFGGLWLLSAALFRKADAETGGR
jgi:hypothetical protein